MARPRKDDTDTRLTARITALLTPADRAALEQAAAEMSMTPSSFTRVWIMKGIRSTEAVRAQLTAQRASDQQLTDELVQHGQRLNALTKLANETQEIHHYNKIVAVAAVLTGIIDRVGLLPLGGKGVSGERRALMNEVTRIGNNFIQLMNIAHSRQHAECLALTDRMQDRIVACVERMIST